MEATLIRRKSAAFIFLPGSLWQKAGFLKASESMFERKKPKSDGALLVMTKRSAL